MSEEIVGNVLPQSLDVERTVLGSMIGVPGAIDMILEHLNEECFLPLAHKTVFECAKDMAEKNFPVDPVTIVDTLRKTKKLSDAGGEAFIAELCESTCTLSNLEYYFGILKEDANLRTLVNVSYGMTSGCFAGKSALDIVTEAEEKIFSIAIGETKSDFESTMQLLPKTFENFEAYYNKNKIGISTGFEELDELIPGLEPGDLIIVAGRPASGKTAFSLSLATNAAVIQGVPTAVFSLEMSKQQLMERMLCSEARVSYFLTRKGMLPKRDVPKLSFAAGPIAEAPLYIDDTPGLNVFAFRSKLRRLKKSKKIKLCVIDYLQLMGSSGKQENRQQEVSHISRSLKCIAKELDMPIIALSQLSRAPESRKADHRPQLSDLRESGSLEQDSDIVLFVYREEMYDKSNEEAKNKAEIIIGKQRNGPPGTANIAFIKEFVRFENLAKNNGEENGF